MDHDNRMKRAMERETCQKICEQAAQWIGSIEGFQQTEERNAFFRWLKDSPEHVREVLAVSAIEESLSAFDYRKSGFNAHLSKRGNVVPFAGRDLPRSTAPAALNGSG
jgi:ferric-dicitrate binding protein FerR (iron transport regulator)